MDTLKLICIVFFISSVFLQCNKNPKSPAQDNDVLQYVAPEELGYSSEALEQVKQLAEQSGYAAIMSLQGNKVFFSFGNISENYWCHSIRKPFLSALYGIHIDLGNINIDATMEDLNIDDIPPALTSTEKQATVRDLLKSRSGIYHPAAAEAQAMIDERPARGSHPHGTYYYYNNWDFNTLGTIFEQQTGTSIFNEFKKQIADAIGMEDFSVNNCNYQLEPEKSMHPAYIFRMSARDMARFGLLYLNNGKWRDKQIIPAEWIIESTTIYSIMDSTFDVGYGYMWMIAPEGSAAADLFVHPCYFHTGAGVHLLIVMPDADLVIIIRLDTNGEFEDPGDEIQMQLIQMIVNARNE